MVEKTGHIKNPLTVIAMFAGIAEISGTVVLPFMAPANQSTYIWFLMVFPIFLVGLFFLTLNFNHRALYAPSDYNNEDNFIKSLREATTEEKEQKLREEAEETIDKGKREILDFSNIDDWLETNTEGFSQPLPAPAPQTAPKATGNVSSISKDGNPGRSKNNQSKFSEFMAYYNLAENLSINKLSKEIGAGFKRGVSIETSDKRKILFNGLATHGNAIHAVEVKLFRNRHVIASRFDKVLFESESLAKQLKETDQRNFVLHIYAVIDNPEVNLDIVRNRLSEYAAKFNIDVKVHASTLSDLCNEIQYSP